MPYDYNFVIVVRTIMVNEGGCEQDIGPTFSCYHPSVVNTSATSWGISSSIAAMTCRRWYIFRKVIQLVTATTSNNQHGTGKKHAKPPFEMEHRLPNLQPFGGPFLVLAHASGEKLRDGSTTYTYRDMRNLNKLTYQTRCIQDSGNRHHPVVLLSGRFQIHPTRGWDWKLDDDPGNRKTGPGHLV